MSLLASLLLDPRDPNAVVAQGQAPGGSATNFVTWAEFRDDVARLAARLSKGPEGPWVLLTEDAYAFIVGLFGLWHAGRYALSPPNHQPESLRALQVRASGVLTDRPDWFELDSTLDPLSISEPSHAHDFQPLDRSRLALELYTSGTTGDGKAVTKQISHLEDELEELARTWDRQLEMATVFSTASHQHLYCLMLGVLWPLCSGRPIERRHYLHAAELVPRMKACGSSILLSVPTHLRRFVRHAQASQLKPSCRAVFSSGGPLPRETAYRVKKIIGQSPIEIFGSTETGIIAWRSQEEGRREDLWAPTPSVRVLRDPTSSALRVLSPFVSVASGEEGLATGDHVEIRDENRFVLLPRKDRIVKIGEKRLDLSRMESDLRGLEWVDEVALAPIERDSDLRVAAVLVPTEEGRQVIDQGEPSELIRAIRGRLFEAWDPVLHPRLWRMVDQLPENAQGKVTREAIVSLFQDDDDQPMGMDRATVLEQLRGEDFVERSCVVPDDLACFAGHFPGHPVVPAVLQLDWVMEAASELIGSTPGITSIPKMKMLMQLQPQKTFRLRVRHIREGELRFQIWGDEGVFTRGRLHFGKD